MGQSSTGGENVSEQVADEAMRAFISALSAVQPDAPTFQEDVILPSSSRHRAAVGSVGALIPDPDNADLPLPWE
jgi:hypothetical protein